MDTQQVCVYCGSHTGNDATHIKFARLLGEQLAQNHIGLVFGGGGVGLMNEVADAVIAEGGRAHGIVPDHLNRPGRIHNGLNQLDVTKTMHERKASMASLADAFIALPGGFGTFEELLETITWAQLGLHSKPVIIANVNGYYDQLINFIGHAVDMGFITQENQTLLKTATSVEDCMSYLGRN